MRAAVKHVANGVFASLLCLDIAAAGEIPAPRVEALLQSVPLSFEANTGRFDTPVRFFSRGKHQNLFLTDEGMVLTLDKPGSEAVSVLRLEIQGASGEARLEGVDRLPAITNYFSAGMRITNVPNFLRVRHIGVYPGIDILYYGNAGQIEYDLVVSPGADPGRIRLKLRGHASARIAESGDLVLSTYSGDVLLKKPLAYQEKDGGRVEVPVAYALAGDELRFDVGEHDKRRAIVIDPVLSYSTYLGGSDLDRAYAIAVDSAGSAYVVGESYSTDFPLAGALQTKKLGSSDAFVTKLNANGTGLVYSTYIGGKNGNTAANGVAVDADGNAYIAGTTSSSAYPVTSGAYRTSGCCGFVTKLNAQGNALVYSTFTGAQTFAIALDGSRNAYVTGEALLGFPTTPGAFQPDAAGGSDAYVLKLNATGSAAVYATFLGGGGADAGMGITVDAAGSAYVAGYTESTNFPVNAFQSSFGGVRDAFVTKLDPTGAAAVYSSYLGGTAKDEAHGVAVDADGNAYLAGTTYSDDFPVLRAFQPNKARLSTDLNQAFVAKVDASGASLVYSSYLGGDPLFGCDGLCFISTDNDNARAIAVDAAGNAYVAGQARTVNFPQVEPIQTDLVDYGPAIPFVAKVADRSVSTLVYSATLGYKIDTTQNEAGGATGVAVAPNGGVYVSGHIGSPRMPTTPGAVQALPNVVLDAVVFKVSAGRFTTALSVSNSAPTSAQAVTLTATVSSGVPNGQVTFYDNGNSFATVAVSAGTASYTTVFNAGVHELTAVYSGDNKVSRPLFLPVKQAVTN